jgi:sensor histidine kinase YesM
MDSDKSARTLEEELNYVRLYLEMEKLRFEEHLNYLIAVNENVNIQILIPNMVLHTFTENAIKHGIKNKTGPGVLKIEAVVKEQGVLLSVSDNGIGRAAAKQANGVSTRQGLEILGRQIELYNQQNKNKIRQTVQDLTDENGVATGTCFSVFIPDEYRYEL